MTWRVNDERVRKIAAALGISRPVRVRVSRLAPEIRGVQSTTSAGHLIRVAPEIDAKQANKTLLHELWHCRQREELIAEGKNPAQVYGLFDLAVGYERNPLEREADEFACAASPLVTLVEAA